MPPRTFMRLTNHVLHAYIRIFVVVYFDDILIFRKNLDEHAQHLRLVFEIFRNEKFYANIKALFVHMKLFSWVLMLVPKAFRLMK